MECYVKNAKGNLVATFDSKDKATAYVESKPNEKLIVSVSLEDEKQLPVTAYQLQKKKDGQVLGTITYGTKTEAMFAAMDFYDGISELTLSSFNQNGYKLSEEIIGKHTIWWEKNKSKWFVRYPISVFWILLGYFLLDIDSTHVYKSNSIHIFLWAGCLSLFVAAAYAYELTLIALAIAFIWFVFDSLQGLSLPVAVIIGAIIIAYAINANRGR